MELIRHQLVLVPGVNVAFAYLSLKRVKQEGIPHLVGLPTKDEHNLPVLPRLHKWNNPKPSQVPGPSIQIQLQKLKLGLLSDRLLARVEKPVTVQVRQV